MITHKIPLGRIRSPNSDILKEGAYQCEKRPDNEHPDLLIVYDYWMKKCTELGRLPMLIEVELMDIWQVAKKTIIVDLVEAPDGPDRFFFRYYGTEVRRNAKLEMTNMFMDEIFPKDQLEEASMVYHTVLETGIPNVWSREVDFTDETIDVYSYTRLIVPLLDKNEKPAHVLGVFHRHPQTFEQ